MITLYNLILAAMYERTAALKLRWQAVADREDFAQLDESSLRDLGVDRSELKSFRAEAHSAQPSSRRRVAN